MKKINQNKNIRMNNSKNIRLKTMEKIMKRADRRY